MSIWEVEKAIPIETIAGVIGAAVNFKESREIFRFYNTPLVDNIGGFLKFQPGLKVVIKSKGIGKPLGIHMINSIELSPQCLISEIKLLPFSPFFRLKCL